MIVFFGYSYIFSIVNILYFVTFFNQMKFKDYENLSILREFIVLFSQIISRYFCIILTNYVELCNCFFSQYFGQSLLYPYIVIKIIK